MRVPAHHLPALADVPVAVRPAAQAGVADVQVEHAALTPEHLAHAIDGVVAARVRGLAARPVATVIAALVRLAACWQAPASTWRRQALAALPATSGLSPEMIAATLPGLFAPYTAAGLQALVETEAGGPAALDGFVTTPWGRRHAAGPRLVAYVGAGNVPGLALPVLAAALIAKAAVVIKSAAGEPVLPALLGRSLAEVDAALGACVAVAHWAGGTVALDEVLLARADVVVAEGGDDAVAALRGRWEALGDGGAAGRGRRFLGFGRRASCAVVAREATADLAPLVAGLAHDVALHDQHGCLSPQVVYVERGGLHAPLEVAEALGAALVAVTRELPRGALGAAEHVAIRTLRERAEWRAARGEDVRLFGDAADTGPTVLYEADPRFEPTCLGRTVRVKPLADLADLPAHLGPWAAVLEAVGAAGPPARLRRLALVLAECSAVTRVGPIGHMQAPPLGWRRGGYPPLGALLRWIDLETPCGGRPPAAAAPAAGGPGSPGT